MFTSGFDFIQVDSRNTAQHPYEEPWLIDFLGARSNPSRQIKISLAYQDQVFQHQAYLSIASQLYSSIYST